MNARARKIKFKLIFYGFIIVLIKETGDRVQDTGQYKIQLLIK